MTHDRGRNRRRGLPKVGHRTTSSARPVPVTYISLMSARSSATCSIDPGPVPGEARSRRPGCRSHIGCPRWSCGSHLACVARASPGPGEAQEGFAQLEVALPSRLDNHIGSSIGSRAWSKQQSGS